MRGPRGIKAAILLLGAPLVASVGLRAIADQGGDAIGKQAESVAEALEDALPPLRQPPAALPPLQLQRRAVAQPVVASSAARTRATDQEKNTVSPKAYGLLVPRARVIQAAKAGFRPSGTPAAKAADRPSGMALSGVSGIGAGLKDGDVVVRVGGTRATSAQAVVNAVAAALRARRTAIVAEVWRGHQKMIVTVELPLLATRRRRRP